MGGREQRKLAAIVVADVVGGGRIVKLVGGRLGHGRNVSAAEAAVANVTGRQIRPSLAHFLGIHGRG
jgi:hypothetical protein